MLCKISNDFKKFLIIPEIEKYSFKKFEYGNVKLIDIKNTEFNSVFFILFICFR